MAQNERQKGALRVKSVVKARERRGQRVKVLPIRVRSFIYNREACQISVDGNVSISNSKPYKQVWFHGLKGDESEDLNWTCQA